MKNSTVKKVPLTKCYECKKWNRDAYKFTCEYCGHSIMASGSYDGQAWVCCFDCAEEVIFLCPKCERLSKGEKDVIQKAYINPKGEKK